MQGYSHILLTTDLSPLSEPVGWRARDLAAKYQATFSILHIVENLPIVDSSYGPIVPFDVDLTEQMVETAQNRLREWADRLGIPETQRFVETGSPKTEIIRVAEEKGVDLIVLGSHGRHGIGLLLGSTASSVIHHARCDVLAVRLSEA